MRNGDINTQKNVNERMSPCVYVSLSVWVRNDFETNKKGESHSTKTVVLIFTFGLMG